MKKVIIIFLLAYKGFFSQTMDDPDSWKIWENGWSHFIICSDSICELKYYDDSFGGGTGEAKYSLSGDSLFIDANPADYDSALYNYYRNEHEKGSPLLDGMIPFNYRIKYTSFEEDTLRISGVKTDAISGEIEEVINQEFYKLSSYFNPEFMFDSLYFDKNTYNKSFLWLYPDGRYKLFKTRRNDPENLKQINGVLPSEQMDELTREIKSVDFERLNYDWYDMTHILPSQLKVYLGKKVYSYEGCVSPIAFYSLVDFLKKTRENLNEKIKGNK